LWADHDGSTAIELVRLAMVSDEQAGIVTPPATNAEVDAITARARMQFGDTAAAVGLEGAASCEEALAWALALPPPPS
jgi:hypothetical protein